MDASTLRRAFGPAFLALLVGSALHAQDPVHTHIRHAADQYVDTPGGWGLLPTAVAEARVAFQHAELAARDSVGLNMVRQHVAHVLHALDPSVEPIGPGLGYGVRLAVAGAAQHMELALGFELSENVTVHGTHIPPTLQNAIQWTDEAIALAQGIQSAASAATAAPLVRRLETLCHSILYGRDTNRDGLVGWEVGEGGLAQATAHMNLLKRGEGL
jgi:hypothetical protein